MDLSTNLLLTYIAITSSSVFYTIIWVRPSLFVRAASALCGTARPVRVMAITAHALKLAQFALIGASVFTALPGSGSGAPPVARLLATLRQGEPRALALLAGCLALAAFGQVLNARVYYLLGEGGVYYGNLLEPHVKRPWVTAWPYSSRWLQHPQYLGSSLCLLGAAGAGLIHPRAALAWAANYAYLALLESDLLCTPKRGKGAE